MKEIKISSADAKIGFIGQLTHDSTFNSIVGELLALIEMLALPTKQEDRAKDMVKKIVYNQKNNSLHMGCGLTYVVDGLIRQKKLEAQRFALENELDKNMPDSSLPMVELPGHYEITWIPEDLESLD